MSTPGGINHSLLASSAAVASQIERSLRFNSSDSAYLSRVFSSAGNQTAWTYSFWVKRFKLDVNEILFGYLDGGANNGQFLRYLAGNTVDFSQIESGSYTARLITEQGFRDPSAWAHMVVVWDSSNGTANDRHRIYINGIEVEQFSTRTDPSPSLNSLINTAVEHGIGTYGTFRAVYLSAYLADIHFIDGQALDPTSFTETDATTGQLIPKAYSGAYGTNGFHLPFSDNSTAAALGTDTSGNSNTWIVNNISVAAGADNDSLVDIPTNYGEDTGAGGEVRGNYATFNPIALSTANYLANGNLYAALGAQGPSVSSTIFVNNGKWYWEILHSGGSVNNGRIGVISSTNPQADLGETSEGWCILTSNGNLFTNNVSSSFSSAIVSTDIIQIALDQDSGKIWYGKNGTWLSGDPALGTSPAQTLTTGLSLSPAVAFGSPSGGINFTANFGQRPFAYTAPSGFKALCTTNFDDSLVTQPSTVMDVVTYTGNGSTQTISGLGFSPDFVWTKSRVNPYSHLLYDTIRGATNFITSNNTSQENTDATSLTAFNSDGFTLGSTENSNISGSSVAWCWDAGSSTVSNTDGSITSSVRANPTAGFSIVSYTGTGSTATVGHGLGAKPELIMCKKRSDTADWAVQHTVTGATERLELNSYGGTIPLSSLWDNTEPTSTVFTVGTDNTTNASAATYIAYCWAPIEGYSHFGSYIGNGSADGPFVYTGFRPRWIVVKNATSIGNWVIFDTSRLGYNIYNEALYTNSNAAEATVLAVDILSNGFKIRATGGDYSDATYTYITMAFAELPFKYARAR